MGLISSALHDRSSAASCSEVGRVFAMLFLDGGGWELGGRPWELEMVGDEGVGAVVYGPGCRVYLCWVWSCLGLIVVALSVPVQELRVDGT